LSTPHLDRLASEGVNFSQFNVLSPVCSPSRAAAMTGRYPARYRINEHFAKPEQNRARGMPDWLDPNAPTLQRILKEAGYRTGHFGKWHLTNRETFGAPTPDRYGFDEWAIFNGGGGHPQVSVHDTARNAAAFIRANRAGPFYVNVWLHETHTPHAPKKESMERWKHLDEQRQVYAAVITDGDAAVGEVLDAIREAGVETRTIVIFSSDNGPERTGKPAAKWMRDDHAEVEGYGTYCSVGETGGLRGRKRSLFEGGVRTPFIVRWPGRAPAGVVNDATVLTAVDLLPTVCAAAGVAVPGGVESDGENLVAALLGGVPVRTRPIFWHWPGFAGEPDWWPRWAVRDGDWKLAMTDDGGRVELYRVADDRAEARDVAKDHPDVVARLTKLALDWKTTLPETPDPSCISPVVSPP
jgi:N-acetylgalactosamine-6-sulfatase